MPTIAGIGCEGTQTYSIQLWTCGGNIGDPPVIVAQNYVVEVEPADCMLEDKRGCPAGGGAGTSAGGPINIGSGDVSYVEPLFTIAQDPLSLVFSLTYHSEPPLHPLPAASRVGLGWTHTFAQTLKDVGGGVLHHVTPEGFDSEYTQSGGVWNASRPGELRGQVTLVSGEYRLTDLDGTITAFDPTTGRWKYTKDRWNNQITGTYNGSGELTTLTDSMGRQVTLAYTGGKLTTITTAQGVWKLEYAGNLLTKLFDPAHSGMTAWRTFSYVNDSLGVQRLLSDVRDESVSLETHTYDEQDRGLTSASQGGAGVVTIDYDTPGAGQRRVRHAIDGALEQVSDFTLLYQGGRFLPTQIIGVCATCGGAGSDSQAFTYTPDNHVLSRTDGATAITTYSYNADGNVLSRTEAAGAGPPLERPTTYEYGYAAWPNFRTKMAEPSAAKPGSTKETTYTWNTGGTPETTLTVVEKGYLAATDGATTDYTTTTTFDSRHRRTATTGPATNQKTNHTYFGDAATTNGGRLQTTEVHTSATAHLDTKTEDYDLFGTPLKVTDPNLVETLRTTDGKGRVLSVTSKKPTFDGNEPPDYMTTYQYDLRDRLTKVILPRLNEIRYTYEDGTNHLLDTVRVDSSGNLKERIHLTLNTIGGEKQEDLQLCTAGNCSTWTTQRTDSFTYDSKNRLQIVTHPDATHIDYTYDSRGNLLTVKDERHSTPNTTYGYDLLNRLTSVTQTLGGGSAVTAYGYDAHDNLTSVIDPNGNLTTYEYDDFRRLQKQISPVTGTTTYAYDPAGNLLTATDANSAVTARTYDAANRILTASSTQTGRPMETVTWTYDHAVIGAYGKGRVARMTDPTGTTQYSYDRRGLLKTDRKSVWDNTFATLYTYDANGNRATVTYPSKQVVTYAHDFADRPVQASGQLTPNPVVNYITSASYEALGPPKELKFGNGTTRTMDYNQRYFMTLNKLTRDSDSAVLADYHTYVYDGVGNITAIPDFTNSAYSRTTLGYDDLNRLTSASTGGSLWGSGSFAYDTMGNITSLTLGSRTASFSYVQSGGHQTPKILQAVESAPFGTRNVTYDAAGNETQVGTAAYVYSARSSLAVGDGFAYDYDGRGVRTVAREDKLAITSLSPTSRAAGLGAFTLTVNGTKFTASSVVRWNGSNRTTTFVSATQLTASINAADVAAAGTITPVEVVDGPSTSNAASFVVDFTDVPSNNAFHPAVTVIAARKITAGTGGGNYSPNAAVTRAQMAVFLLKSKEGSGYTPPPCTGIFSDVPCPGGFAVDWIEELANRGITAGCTPTTFCPNNPVTRAQMAVFLLKTLEGSTYVPPACTGIFSDVPCPGGFAVTWIEEIARRGITAGCLGGSSYCPNDSVTRGAMAVFLQKTWGFTLNATPAGLKRFFFYTPELNLISESEYTSAYHPQVFYEHFWFNGAPVAEVDTGTSTTHWTLTDHLGTPILWTDSAVNVSWRVEHEPYGRVFSLRQGSDIHQPLRLPGQEAEQLPTNGLNGATEKSYNIFRWYRPTWGRYTQNDPETRWWLVHPEPYGYVRNNPVQYIDRLGLYRIAGNCSLTGLDVAGGIRDLCSSKTLPGTKCSRALANISAAIGGGTNLNRCFEQSCQGSNVIVQCDPCFDKCAQTSAGLGSPIITIGGGNTGCPNNRGLGLGETLLHETLHVCAFGNPVTDEPHLPGYRAAWFRYAEDACYGWRDPNAPPFGPPQ